MKNILEAAKALINSGKYNEVNGRNRSAGIDALCKEFGMALGSPYCAMGISKAAKMVAGLPGLKFPYSAGSQSMLAAFRKADKCFVDPQHLLKVKGALAIRTDPGGKHGHVLLVSGRLTDSRGKVVAISTAEFNTNLQGSRDGEGSTYLRRDIPLTPYAWTFVDLSDYAGGVYW